MFKYQNDHPQNFVDKHGEKTFLPSTMIILMQLGTSIATELINLLLIIESPTAKDTLMNFVALEVICQIDDIYFSTLKKEPLKACVTENTPEITYTTKTLRKSGRFRS